jgi:hypothetical protein
MKDIRMGCHALSSCLQITESCHFVQLLDISLAYLYPAVKNSPKVVILSDCFIFPDWSLSLQSFTNRQRLSLHLLTGNPHSLSFSLQHFTNH